MSRGQRWIGFGLFVLSTWVTMPPAFADGPDCVPSSPREGEIPENISLELDTDRRIEMYHRYMDFPNRVKGGRVNPHWLEGDRFEFEDLSEDPPVLWRVDPEANRQVRFEQTPEGEEPDDGGESGGEEPRKVRDSIFPGMPPVMELPSPDGRYFLTEYRHDLWLRPAGAMDSVPSVDRGWLRLTDDGTESVDWRIAQDDHWSIGLWSPDSRYVAVMREDRRGVHQMPVVDWLSPHEKVEWRPIVRSGEPLARTELWLIEIPTVEDEAAPRPIRKRPVATLPGEAFFHLVGFRERETETGELVYLRAERVFEALTVRAVNPRTGQSRTVLEEKSETFIKNLGIEPAWTELLTPLAGDEGFVWQSERDGWDHLYLYDWQGRLVRRLTAGSWPVLRVRALDEEGWVYFTGHREERIYDTHLYRVSLEGGAVQRLTEGEGRHQITFSPSKRFFLDRHSTVERPWQVDLRRADGRFLRTLTKADISALDGLCWTAPEPFVALAADGETELHGTLFKPWDFDPEHSYPVIEHIYAGPFLGWAPRDFTTGRWRGTYAQALAQLGYITFIVDGRGTPGRSKAFQDHVYGRMGQTEVPDHLAVLRQLVRERPYLDGERVGIFGGSWGGYMTVRALLLEPGAYAAGSATNPVYDFDDHGAIGLEGYLGRKDRHPERYAAGSSLDLVHRLEAPLLLIHGARDVNATFSTTMKMVHALMLANKPYELVVLPSEVHHFFGPARTYQIEAQRRFFDRHLRPGLPAQGSVSRAPAQ